MGNDFYWDIYLGFKKNLTWFLLSIYAYTSVYVQYFNKIQSTIENIISIIIFIITFGDKKIKICK